MDSVRTAKRLGAERAIIIYRRSRTEMPARVEEVHHAEEEGIEFLNLANPVEYFADEDVLTENWTPRDIQPSPTAFAEWAIAGGIDGNTRRQKQGDV